MARHQSAGEEIPGDPVVVSLEAIGAVAVSEYVQEQPAIRRQPGGHPRQQIAPVAHVLEHLHRHHPVENAFRLEVVHVGGDHGEVGQAHRRRPRLDLLTLGAGVRYADDCRARIVRRHPKAERAPAAAELQNPLAVGKSGVNASLCKRPFFPLREGGVWRLVQAAGIFQPRPEDEAEEGRRDLIVLGVGLGCAHRDRAIFHVAHEGGVVRSPLCEFASRTVHEKGDRATRYGVGYWRAFGQTRHGLREAHAATRRDTAAVCSPMKPTISDSTGARCRRGGRSAVRMPTCPTPG